MEDDIDSLPLTRVPVDTQKWLSDSTSKLSRTRNAFYNLRIYEAFSSLPNEKWKLEARQRMLRVTPEGLGLSAYFCCRPFFDKRELGGGGRVDIMEPAGQLLVS